MAALTWRDVVAPSFAGANQAYQGAGATLDRALSGLSEGLKQFAADRQAGVDNSILARSLAIQDPAAMRQALASGSLLQGADLTKVNPKVLENLNNRVGTLLNQASTEQGISSSKTSQAATQQNIDFGQQDQDRKISQQVIEDAARPQLARELNITGPAANMSTDALQKFAGTRSTLASAELSRAGQRISNATGSFNLSRNQRDDAAQQAAFNALDTIQQRNGTVDDMRTDLEEMPGLTSQQRALVQRGLEQSTGQRLYAPVDTAGSVAASAKGGKAAAVADAGPSNPVAREALALIGRAQSQRNSVGVAADVEKNLTDSRSVPELIKEISGNFPDANQGELTQLVTNALDKYPNLSAADAVSALNRSITGNWLGSTRFADGVGVDDQKFDANLQSFVNGKADRLSARGRVLAGADTAIRAADKKLADARSSYAALVRRSQSQTGIDTSKAEERVKRAQTALDDVIGKFQNEPEFQPQYVVPIPNRPRTAAESRNSPAR